MDKRTPKERPIIFSADSVREILAERKTQTRRVIKPQPMVDPKWTGPHVNDFGVWFWTAYADRPGFSFATQDRLPRLNGKDNMSGTFFHAGDRLWVREKFWAVERQNQGIGWPFLIYDDEWDGALPNESASLRLCGFDFGVHPSVHMPRWASRLTLEVTGIRVERVQDISEADALAEGIRFHDGLGVGHSGYRWGSRGLVYDSARDAYAAAWDSINAKRGHPWASNSWVWVIEFRRLP